MDGRATDCVVIVVTVVVVTDLASDRKRNGTKFRTFGMHYGTSESIHGGAVR